jgi:hypothetical protein
MLQTGVQEGAKPMTLTDGLLDNVIAKMTARAQSNKGGPPSKDQQLEAVRRFWDGQEITQFRDAYHIDPARPAFWRTAHDCNVFSTVSTNGRATGRIGDAIKD